MAWFTELESDRGAERAEKLMALPLGAASPLWAAYMGMAAAGVGLWWMSRLTKPVNLEAMFPDFSKYMPETPPFAPLAETLAALQPEPHALPEATLEPVVAAAEAVEEVEEALAVPVMPDDLTQLVGIGPTLASKLGDLGVTTFAQIAAWTDADIDHYDKTLKLIGRVKREDWIGQASQFAEA